MNIKDLYQIYLRCAGLNTDTRTIREGQLFLALKGENFDGNAFALQALEAGAAYAVVNDTIEADDPRLIKVPDTLAALQQLAAYHRQQFDIPVIGLTGTNGKTTTKELIKAVLSAKYCVTATEGNLNNDIGVPLSVLKISVDTQIAIIEMGASHPEDLKPLLAVSQPTHGLITNVGKAHLLGFGSFEGVKHAKGLLYDYLKEHEGVAFANADDAVLQEMLWDREMSRIPYGMEGVKLLPASADEPFVQLQFPDGGVLKTHLVGAYNANNVLAALKIGWFFDVPEADARAAVEAYVPSNNRSQLLKTERNTVIVDAYNANPSSMAVALDNLAFCTGRKVALLGDMRELGADAAAEHKKVVERILSVISSEAEKSPAFLVGEEFTRAAAGTGIPCFATSDDLAAYLQQHPLHGCTVLVKGSRGIRMEKVLPTL
ncbi:MAG: UDP-N-acetylmuramoyl-tripeptide--D-alanyl-D-alanine ligase [Bacteroidales bacterium]|nr:UDP-N-acetylmuramoyl-tripeptide--D-alanyl-D-alanine ligase [Bacteroidales bacterium]